MRRKTGASLITYRAVSAASRSGICAAYLALGELINRAGNFGKVSLTLLANKSTPTNVCQSSRFPMREFPVREKPRVDGRQIASRRCHHQDASDAVAMNLRMKCWC